MSALFLKGILLSVAIFLISCAQKIESNTKGETDLNQTKLVGRVVSISPDRLFVIIQAYGKWQIGTGAFLRSEGLEERRANLLVTGEKMGQFVAADVRSGNIAVGDAVYQIAILSTNPEENPISPEVNDSSLGEAVP